MDGDGVAQDMRRAMGILRASPRYRPASVPGATVDLGAIGLGT